MKSKYKFTFSMRTFVRLINSLPEWNVEVRATNLTQWGKMNGITFSMISKYVRLFSEMGLIEFIKVKDKWGRVDNRTKHFYITEKGKKIRKELNLLFNEYNQDLFSIKNV